VAQTAAWTGASVAWVIRIDQWKNFECASQTFWRDCFCRAL
jgi:hypothetical protein